MLQTRWQKVFVDLWRNWARTLVVALAIAVGVYAVGVVLDVREVLVREYRSDQAAALVASAGIYTQPFDDELAERLAEIPGVAAAEGRRVVRTRFYRDGGLLGSDPDGEPLDLNLVAVPDFEAMGVDALIPLSGQWPPGEREVILERQALDYLGVSVGDVLAIELENDATKTLTVVGTAHDPQQLSPRITDRTYGFVTLETMGALGLEEVYSELRVRVAEHTHDEAHIQGIVDAIEDQLERGGRELLGSTISTESYIEPFIDTIVLFLSSFGAIILVLSGFLVVNAISALITQQVPQIGVMKLVGARRVQIMGLYLVMVLAYGVLAVAVGIPLAILSARLLMTELVEGLVNVMPDSYAVSAPTILFQVAIGLLLPVLAGLAPVLKGTQITTRKALNDVGLQAGAQGQRWIEGLLAAAQKLRSVQRPVVLALRNTLRHKGRLAQTLLVLTVGTALFISVLSVRASVDATLESFMRFHRYDVSVGFEQPYRLARLEAAAREVPGVVEVEGWSMGNATRLRPDGSEGDGLQVVAVPPGTTFMAPELSEGQWLPADGDGGLAGRSIGAVVVNSDVLDKEPDLRVGDPLVLDLDGRETAWQVVGIVTTESRGPALYVALDDYAFVTRTPGQANHLQVIAEQHSAEAQREMEALLFQHFEAGGLDVSRTETAHAIRDENELLFTIVVAFLILMALLLAAVGGLGLTTTMSINILERVREIGVLRAIGASNLSVRWIVLVEGMIMGLLSWGIGTLLSVPISSFMSARIGLMLIDIPLRYQYSLLAAGLWFVALQLVAVVASLGPARNAVRLTIREVLAYE